MVFSAYDTNKSGVFEKDEWKNFRTDPTPWDYNETEKSLDELVKGMSNAGGGRSGGREQSGRDRSPGMVVTRTCWRQ